MFQHQFAVGGQADTAAVPVDQVAAEAGFQRLDAATERRLAEVHGFGGPGEMAVLGKGDKMAKLAKVVHALIASFVDLECIGIIAVAWPLCQYRQ